MASFIKCRTMTTSLRARVKFRWACARARIDFSTFLKKKTFSRFRVELVQRPGLYYAVLIVRHG